MKLKMKKMIALFLLVFMICTIQPITTMAKNETGHQISVKVYKVVIDSTKPLGYQTPELVTTTTVICQDRMGHSGYNHFVNLKDFYPTNFNLSTSNWTGWQFSSYYEKGQDRETFYSWTKDQINATANVVGSQPYPCSKNFYMVYKEETKKYTVTYTDGVMGEVFADKVNNGIPSGANTPQFGNDPVRPGYIFTGWTPAVSDKVTGDVTYTATWAEDKNNNGIDDATEDKYTVIYTDGVEGEEVFADKVTSGLLEGDATPQFGNDPVRPGYIFTGWTPVVSDKVTGDVTYTATWKPVESDTVKPDSNESDVVKPESNESNDVEPESNAVESDDKEIVSPYTGDNSNVGLWIAILLASGMGVVVATVYGKKRKYQAQ